VQIPHLYTPRDYQLPFWLYMGAPGATRQRAALVWHRRAGKDKTAWNWMIYSAVTQRCGTYYFFTPTYSQGKKILWDGMDGDGLPFRAHVPDPEILVDKNEVEMQMKVRHVSGGISIIQIVGTDRLDSIRGTNPVGVAFDEYSFQNPRAWDIVEPILLENGGWAVFVFTPNGKNHAADLWESAVADPQWYTSLLTIRDTKRPDGSPVIDEKYIDGLRKRGVDEETIQAEYYCSFTGGVVGSYYAKFIEAAYASGRVTNVPHEPNLPVETWWDLGVGDATAIWFVQRVNRELRAIDYIEASGEGLPYYAKELKDRPYVYSAAVMPHDAKVRELGSGKSRVETAAMLGIRPVIVAPKLPIDDGVNAVRQLLPRFWFDKDKCATRKYSGHTGLGALTQYRKKFDEERKVYANTPEHDWSSHAADAFRTGAVGAHEALDPAKIPQYADGKFDPLTYEADREREGRDWNPYDA
jgi:hypothetical protein